MSASRSEETIFAEALGLPPEERAAYLAQATRDEPELRAEVESLLRNHGDGEFLEAAAVSEFRATVHTAPVTEGPGNRIGRYKLLQQIGEGGCGVVYMAEQTEPVRRRVAFKIIKLGMDTRSVIARFEAERQALAMMDHPNIAKVLDAGATETGRPYFVMELVRGMRITDYCDEKKLPTRERLDLFVQVCNAIQHAHQKGIIHRDLKPSNVLVTVNDGVPVPKVIDFGIAKATSGQLLTDKTLFTAFEQFIGTPAYMSPEQAVLTSLDIDTRSDVYALGVLLYELMTGRTPFDARELLEIGLDEMRRTIREAEPPKPSTLVSGLAAPEASTTALHRGLDAPRLASELRGDLDWIVMKCLEKDRARRYETANGLAMDIRRHLDDEPVVACPPSRWYALRKAVRRHKIEFVATAAVILALVAGIAMTTWQAIRATHAEKRTVTVLDELRATAPAFAAQARSLAAQERFDEAIEKLDNAIKLRPDAPEYLVRKADLLQSQLKIGKIAEAAVYYREALRLNPELTRAETSANLCDELLEATPGGEDSLSRASLVKLLKTMEQQQRPAAERLPVARVLHEEKEVVLELWREKLKVLPIPPGKPLEERLTMAEDSGRLMLDLDGTNVADLEPLRGMPLGWLDLDGCDGVESLEPLRGAPLRTLWLHGLSALDNDSIEVISSLTHLKVLSLAGTAVTDLSPLQGLELVELRLDRTRVADLTPLRGMPLTVLTINYTKVRDLSPLAGIPLTVLETSAIPADDFSPLAGAPLETCSIQHTPIRDLSFLDGAPVRDLVLFGCDEARGYDVLPGLKSLCRLVLPASFYSLPPEEIAAIGKLRHSPTLTNIDTAEDRAGIFQIETILSKEEFWKSWDQKQFLGEASLLARQGKWKEAAERYDDLIRIDPNDSAKYFRRASLLIASGDLESYRAFCQEIAEHFHSTNDTGFARDLAKVLLIRKDSGVDPVVIDQMAKKSVSNPNDVWNQLTLGLAAYRQQDFSETINLANKALRGGVAGGTDAVNLRDVFAYNLLAMAHHQLNRTEESCEAYARAAAIVRMNPLDRVDIGSFWWEWIIQHTLKAEAEAVIGDGAKLNVQQILADHGLVDYLDGLADTLAGEGRWVESADCFDRLLDCLEQDDTLHLTKRHDHWPYFLRACLPVAAGDQEGYRDYCRGLIKRFADTEDPTIARRMAKACVILPKAEVDLEVIARMAKRGADHRAPTPALKGLVDYRRGRFDRAVKWLNEALDHPDMAGLPAFKVQAYMTLAMAQHCLNNTDEAGAAFAKGRATARMQLPELENDALGDGWWDKVMARALMTEAEELLTGDLERSGQPALKPLVAREEARMARPVTEESPQVQSILVPPTSEWRWLHPVDGTDPKESAPDFHTTFFKKEFDDSGWRHGTDSNEPGGGFGYGDDDWFAGVSIGRPKELLANGLRNGKSAYFRHEFETDREHKNLELRCQRDDGIIIYLDGNEVARNNMLEGEEAYGLPAASIVPESEERTTYRIPLPDVLLKPGEHLLAISLHNPAGGSSDLRIGGISLVEVAPPSSTFSTETTADTQ